MKNNKKQKNSTNLGFTLIITITMMVLLSLIAVGFLSLSTITIRASSTSSAMREAQHNAKMAMILALGDLQAHLGPDQRISATANIAGSATGDELAPGAAPQNNNSVTQRPKGLTSVQNGTRYWTGVFTNRSSPDLIYTETPTPTLQQWLVSGNRLLSASGPNITPASARCVVSANGQVSDQKSAVVLVGNNSVRNSTQYVAVPLLTIGTAGNTTGRYGYWIGDEGVKSIVNRPNTSLPNTSYASIQSTRRGWETVTGLANYPVPSGNTNQLGKIGSLESMELLLNNSAIGLDVFHSATVNSMGVVADTRNGGLRIDLNHIFRNGLPNAAPAEYATILNYPTAEGNIIPRNIASGMLAPRWASMVDFFQRTNQLKSGALTVRGATTRAPSIRLFPSIEPSGNNLLGYTQGSISPLITDFRLLFGVRFRVQGTTFRLNPCGKIAVTLANPYSVPLRWDNSLDLEVIDTTPRTNSGYQPSCIWQHQQARFINRANPSVFGNTLFRIPTGSLAPGEARAYTISGNFIRPVNSVATVVATMAPVSFGLANFEQCVEMETSSQLNVPSGSATLPYDVRESWQTTSATVELRLAGSSASNILRRIERLELDNGYFSPNTRRFNANDITSNQGPVPMMLYSYQLSQPGGQYQLEMPNYYEIGQRGSTLRTFMDFNLQATEFSKPIACYTPPPYFMITNNSFAALGPNSPGGDTGSQFTKNMAINPAPWGYSQLGSPRTVLFSVPENIVSLAQFQHADLTGDDSGGSIGHQPGYAFANSYSTPFVQRARSMEIDSRYDHELTGSGGSAVSINRNYYDISYLLNNALWDSYFLSTMISSGSGEPQNPALIRRYANRPIPNNPGAAAAEMMIMGAFNFNSTDKNAWKAFFASNRFFRHRADTTTNPNVAFPRSLEQLETALAKPSGIDKDSYAGYRRLTDNELELLAQEMVRQVRTRGPFLSLGHFINRSLVAPASGNTANNAAGRSGPLQNALDESGCNINHARNRNAFANLTAASDAMSVPNRENAPRADLEGGDRDGHPGGPDWSTTSRDNNFGTMGSIYADRNLLDTDLRPEQGFRSTAIPGWMTQADVLQVIGSSISARSDTFRIRTYGESTDSAGNPKARAWCEAIVQRLPEYVDPTNAATVRGNALTVINRNYGRKFNIVSFRWLGSNEI